MIWSWIAGSSFSYFFLTRIKAALRNDYWLVYHMLRLRAEVSAVKPAAWLRLMPAAPLLAASSSYRSSGCTPDVEGVNGKFFTHKGVITNSSKVTYDESITQRLWQVSAELTHLSTDH